MIRKKRYNLTPNELTERWIAKSNLMADKEKVYTKEPWQGYCDNADHPLFTIKVTVDRPVAACYYCSKTWIYKDKCTD